MSNSDARDSLFDRLKEIGGCGDSSCAVYVKPNSVVTNGGCRCDRHKLIRAMGAYVGYVAATAE